MMANVNPHKETCQRQLGIYENWGYFSVSFGTTHCERKKDCGSWSNFPLNNLYRTYTATITIYRVSLDCHGRLCIYLTVVKLLYTNPVISLTRGVIRDPKNFEIDAWHASILMLQSSDFIIRGKLEYILQIVITSSEKIIRAMLKWSFRGCDKVECSWRPTFWAKCNASNTHRLRSSSSLARFRNGLFSWLGNLWRQTSRRRIFPAVYRLLQFARRPRRPNPESSLGGKNRSLITRFIIILDSDASEGIS